MKYLYVNYFSTPQLKDNKNRSKNIVDHNDIVNCIFIPISTDRLCGISLIIIFTFFSALNVLSLMKHNIYVIMKEGIKQRKRSKRG